MTIRNLYAININRMQSKRRQEKLSRLRSALRHRLTDLRRILKVAFGRSPLVKGNVYELARKCGKPNCTCTRGELHRSMVLTWSEKGQGRLLSLPPERILEVKRKSEEYLRFRRARAQVTEVCRDILALLDQIEKLRREEVRR